MTLASDNKALDRAIISATQAGLPLVEYPFAAIAAQVRCDAGTVMKRLREMKEEGRVRRIAAVPNHFSLGLRFNGMTVWDVDDTEVMCMGERVGALPFVTHCYLRPRIYGVWRYNLFAMVHGRDRTEAEAKADKIATILGSSLRARNSLFSKRILKKTGFRLQG